MRTTCSGVFACLIIALGCGDQPTSVSLAPALSIQDAAHGGAAGFYFLPPLVKQPSYSGSFDPGASPIVQVCASPACLTFLVTYTMTSGAGSETVRVEPAEQYYIVNWHTARTGAVEGRTYRIRVLRNGGVLGFADVWVAGSGKDAKKAPGDPDVVVLKGGTVPIKFRIETGRVSQLPGQPGDPAVEAIPRLPLIPRLEDYGTGHPELHGLSVSFNTILVVISPAANLAELNTLLQTFSAQIVGGIPGVAGLAGGILILRLPTASHAELGQQLVALRQQPIVLRATPDHLDRAFEVPAPEKTATLPWDWVLHPSSDASYGNWGLLVSRVPQMWNLNRFAGAAVATSRTVVIDQGFNQHANLSYDLDLSAGIRGDHGTHVAGIIGATFGDSTGTDGLNPFVRLIVKTALTFAELSTSLEALITLRPDIRVVNISMGYGWDDDEKPVALRNPTDPRNNPAVLTKADNDGAVFAAVLAGLEARGSPLPVIVTSAGNDADYYPGAEARVASPYNAAALLHGAAPIVVVEANDLNSQTQAISLAYYSEVGGQLGAPGTGVYSTIGTSSYDWKNGTSMAAPHVAGLVGYLYTLDPNLPPPTMHANPIRDLLLANAVPVSGASPRMDAFATAMDLDRIRSNDAILRALLDIDDGTVDGNTRVASNQALVKTDSHGDGAINMADFRRWRDWLLQTEDAPSLDGPLDHPKRDLNGDGHIRLFGVEENIFPRGDFNGDGVISRTMTFPVSGVLGGRSVTDLEVLQERFSDPNYAKAALPLLIDSGDITVDVRACRLLPGVASVRAVIRAVSSPSQPIQQRVLSSVDSIDVFTLPASLQGYLVQIEALDASAAVVRQVQSLPMTLHPGADAFFPNDCHASVLISPNTNVTVVLGGQQSFLASVTGLPVSTVTWTETGGSITQAGVYTAGQVPGTYHVTATSTVDPSVSASVTVHLVAPQAPPPPPAFTLVGPLGAFLPNNLPSENPLRYALGVTNVALDSLHWDVVAGTNVIGVGDLNPYLVTVFTPSGQLLMSDPLHGTVNVSVGYPAIWLNARSGFKVTIGVSVCAYKDGAIMRSSLGNPICAFLQTPLAP